ncbi:hypothetical protein [Burkholderia cepacia]|uniref:hypothetical protein n=1 Tax=Burkholderia cepacia TaxID=292 RepID=UPI000F5EFA12|nr:hypothetical protein [Burkholderia cepacia]RRA01875.1 hypothetical protein DF055_19845 [Burkholderia cepacia]RRA04907.1 hypothetical protein DF054_22645 [Burkholderia cepacia]
MTTNTYGGYTVDQLREFIRHHYDAEHGGDNIDELTNDSSASVKIVRDLLDAIEPQQDGDLLRPIARWVYNAVRVNLNLLHGICSEFGCQQGEDVALWLRDRLSNAKSPAPVQASEATAQRPGMGRPFTEVVPTAEGIVDARAAGGNGTSSKVCRADALTDESARKIAHRIYCNLGYCGSDPRCFNGADSVTQQRWIRAWETDDGRVISDGHKQRMLANGGAEASSVRPYAHALHRSAPAHAAEPVAIPAGYALVPIERSYDMRAKALIAFNTTEQAGKDRDDALDAAYRAELAAAPQPAQADAREGLTDEQISGLADKWAARWRKSSAWNTRRCIDNALREARVLLQGANHA